MRKPDTLLSRTLARFGLASKKQEEQRVNHASRVLRFEPLEWRQLLSVVTWTGLGANNYWGTAANWSTNAAPVAGDDLVFSGSTRTATQNNLTAGTSFRSIEFKNNNFTISGNNLALTSGVIVDSGVTGSSVSAGIGISGTATFNVVNTSMTVSSTISGTGRLTKTGSGSLILTGTDTYSGGTTISAGALQLGAGGSTGSIVGNITDNGQLIVNRTGSLTLSGTISGTGSLTKSGSGTLILSGNNYFFGGTTINAGSVRQDSDTALGYGNLMVAGGSLDMNGHVLNVTGLSGTSSGSIANSLSSSTATLNVYEGGNYQGAILDDLGGSVALHFMGGSNGNGALRLDGYSNYWGGTTIEGGTVTLGSSWGLGYGNVTMNGGILDLSGNDLYIQGLSGDSDALVTSYWGDATLYVWNGGDYEGTISDGYGGVMSLYSTGNLTLGNYNYYTGGTTIGGGTVTAGTDVSLGYGNLTMSGGTLNLNGNNAFIYELNGSASSLITNSVGSSTLNVWSGGSFAGRIFNGSGEIGLSTSGSLTLGGANYFTGGTTINNGTITLENDSALGYGNLTMIGGTLNLNDHDAIFMTLIGDLNSLVTNSSGNSTFQVAFGGTFDGKINDGSGVVALLSAGSLVLSNHNSYSGGTIITSGSLQIGAGGRGGSIDGPIQNDGQLIIYHDYMSVMTSVISGSGSLTKRGSGALYLTGANTYTGGTTISGGLLAIGADGTSGSIVGNVVNNGELVFARTNDVVFAGVISGSGSVIKYDSGKLTLTGANIFTGGTTVNGGTLALGNDSALGYGNLTMGASSLELAGYDATIKALNGVSSAAILNSSGSSTLSIKNGGIYNGKITDLGGQTLVKAYGYGSRLALNNENFFFGGFEIIGGTVQTGNLLSLGYGNVTMNHGSVDLAGVDASVVTSLNGDSYSSIYNSVGSAKFSVGGGGNFSGRIFDGGGSLSLQSDYGTLSLSGVNSYSGGTAVLGGTIKAGSSSALGSGVVNLSSYSSLDLNGGSLTVGGLAGSGVVANSSTTTNSVITTAGTSAFSGIIKNAINGGTKSTGLNVSSGTLTLNGANTFTGGTTIASAATLQLSGGSLTGSVANAGIFSATNSGTLSTAAAISNAGTISLSNSGKLTLSGVISGAGLLVKSGTGEVVLSGANTYTGGTLLSSETLTLGNNAALGAGSLTIENGAKLDMNGFGNASQPLTSVLLTDGYILDGTLAASSSFNLLEGYVSANLTGAAGLTKSGSGWVTLTGTNTYSGSTVALDGTLVVGTSLSLPPGTTVTGPGTVIYAQMLYWNGGSGSWNATNAWHYSNGQLTSWVNGANAIFSGGGTITVSGMVNVVSMTFASGDFTISGGQLSVPSYCLINTGAGTVNVSSALTGNGGLLKKEGDGELVFAGTSSFSGICWTTSGTVNLDFSAMPSSTPTQWIEGDGEIIGPGSIQFYVSAIYDEVHEAFADESIDRNETIALLNVVAGLGSTITASELADLQTLANNPHPFNMLDYVHVLLADVANGNAANAHYQGATLGNLAAGASSTVLTNLKNKWFLGLDRPTASYGTYSLVTGNLANADGYTWDDMEQGAVGDCWLIASLGGIAYASRNSSSNPIDNMLINNGDGTWTVRFYYEQNGVFTPEYVTVDQFLPKTSKGKAAYAAWTNGLWIALIEKAYAQWCETGHSGCNPSRISENLPCRPAVNDYESLTGGYYDEVYSSILGHSSSTVHDMAAVRADLDAGYAVGYGELKKGVSDMDLIVDPTIAFIWVKYNIVLSHAYPIIGYYYDSAAQDYRFVLKNPWNEYQPIDVLAADLDYVSVSNSNGTTPAAQTYASAPIMGAAFTPTSATTSMFTSIAPAKNATAVAATELPFDSRPVFTAYANRLNNVFLNERINETAVRADVIASLFDEPSSHFAATAKFAETEYASDWPSGTALPTRAADYDPSADFDALRHLRANKKVNHIDAAVDSVFAEEEDPLVLL